MTVDKIETDCNSPNQRELSDADLLEREFVSHDPEHLSGVFKALPKDYRNAEIEFSYDRSPPKGQKRRFTWCAHNKKETHWRGFVMKTPKGDRFLVVGV